MKSYTAVYAGLCSTCALEFPTIANMRSIVFPTLEDELSKINACIPFVEKAWQIRAELEEEAIFLAEAIQTGKRRCDEAAKALGHS